MRISIEHGYALSPIASAIGNLFSTVATLCETHHEFDKPGLSDAEIVFTLGGREHCDRWDVRSDALGFQAVASSTRYDSDEDCLEGVNGWIDVNEKNEAIINIAAAEDLCSDYGLHPRDREDDLSFMISMIVTPIHELKHVAEFLERSGGRCPVQVFDEDGGEASLRELTQDGGEDRVESISLVIAEQMYASSQKVRSEVADVLNQLKRGPVRTISI